jgi:hypothetical protein
MIKYYCDACGLEMGYEGSSMAHYVGWSAGGNMKICGPCCRDLTTACEAFVNAWLAARKLKPAPKLIKSN